MGAQEVDTVRGQKGSGAADVYEVHRKAGSMGIEESDSNSGDATRDSVAMLGGDDAGCEHG